MFNGNSVLLRLDNLWSLFGKMSPRRSASDGVDRSEGILSAPLFPRRFAGKAPSGEERENTAVFAGYQNQFIALFTLCKTFIDNLYLKKQTNKEKHSKIIKRVHMCAVFKVAKALYLDLRWTPLWLVSSLFKWPFLSLLRKSSPNLWWEWIVNFACRLKGKTGNQCDIQALPINTAPLAGILFGYLFCKT